jgi:16S rRNA (guanine1207-N2)-methyltransferase
VRPVGEQQVDDPGEHYFSAEPSGPESRRQIPLRLRGHDIEVWTSTGVFSHERVDLGTRVLLREAPDPPATGDLLDLGCGWGPLALAMALDSPGATVWAVDVNTRALALSRDNAAALGLSGVKAVLPEEVPADVEFAGIWSNPPIRVGKEALHSLLLQWLPRLAPGGVAHLVVQRHLGADSLHAWLVSALADLSGSAGTTAYDVRRLGSAKGYRVLTVERQSR